MIPFPFNENRFSFFVADHLLVGQLCTNPKSDRSLLSCLKVTQCSTSEIMYDSCSLPIQVMTTGPLPAPSKCKFGRFNVPRVMKTKFPATVVIFGEVSSVGHIMPPHILEVGLKVNTKMYLDVLNSVVIPWCNQVAGGRPWVWQQDSTPAHKSKETQAWLQKERYDFVPFSHWPPSSPDLNPLDYFVWTSPTWPPTTPKPAWSLPSAEYSPSSRWRLWKRHALSSGSVSRRWLRLKAATLSALLHNQVTWIDFFNKSFKIKLKCCFFEDNNFIVSPCRLRGREKKRIIM